MQPVNDNSEVTYSNQIARIFQNHCVECHRAGRIGPFEMTSYDEVLGWGEMIREVVDQGRMPPWHADPKYGQFPNDKSLTAKKSSRSPPGSKTAAPKGIRKISRPPRNLSRAGRSASPTRSST